MNILPENLLINFGVLAIAFVLLSKGADFLVNGAVGIAYRLNIPKVIIGIVLVSFGTTMPEFTVSVISAVQKHSEIALGNAVGSVIVNVAVALSLGVLVSKTIFDILLFARVKDSSSSQVSQISPPLFPLEAR